MTVRTYRIADIVCRVEMEQGQEIAMFRGFEDTSGEEPTIRVRMYQKSGIFRQCYGIEYCRATEQYPHLFVSKSFPEVRMQADSGFRRFVIEGCGHGENGVMEVLLAGFYSYLSGQGGILAHASLVSFRGEGIIFTAASGTGKTTQARLWQKYRAADILNGDKVILDCHKRNCLAWGSPWKGSSPYAKNESVPLKAVIVLEQAGKNAMRRLEGTEAMALVSPHLFYPMWDENCVEAVMGSLDFLLREVPVWLLSCLPDQNAVDLTCREIWGDGAE